MEKHICEVCGLSFLNKRSLGDHIRNHGVLSSPMEDEEPVNRYFLRDKPKKSRRFVDAERETNVHTKRAKVCSLLNSSSEMHREELNHETDDHLWSNRCYDEKAEKMPSQINSEVSITSLRVKKKKRSSRKVTKRSIFSASTALSSSTYRSREVRGALCLLMLSRGTHSIADLPDKISLAEYENKVFTCPSEDEDQQFSKPNVSSSSRSSDHGIINSTFHELGKRSLSKKCDSEYGTYKSRKINKYVCKICSKSFPSHQALGGHCTSHKKMKGDYHESG